MSNNFPTVYLLQEPTSEKDLSSAEKYGRLKPIIGAEDKPSLNPLQTLNKIYDALYNYDSEQDSLCFAGGDPLVEFLAGIAIERLGIEEVTHLVWNREKDGNGKRTGKGFYVPKKINIFNTQNNNIQGEPHGMG